MNVIIFSKDRAAQLDLLLRGMPEFDEVYVIWTASDNKFAAGYDIIDFRGAISVRQSHAFKDDVVWYVDSPNEYTMFLTDDDIFLRDFDADIRLNPEIACLSLRLNPGMNYCYTLNRPQKAPKFGTYRNYVFDVNSAMAQLLPFPPIHHIEYAYDWRNADADYGYPMSLDGHIFRTADILPLLEKLDYHNPNTLEGQLACHPINRPMMMCFDKSVIVNNPINSVQSTVPNRHGTITAEWLNEQFLAGKRIKLEPFIGYEPNACHVELPIIME